MTPVSQQHLDDLAISRKEYGLIVSRLGREPNLLELGLFGSLWSEHCGYKHSKMLLKQFPHKSPRVLVGPGEENAGAVDIGDGLAIVMKVESHNHPSAVEPFQGAATGVGGIVRDIFTMGARPIALLNSLRFGPLSEPRNRYLFGGVVGGISSYGNCLGIPDVAGEVSFSSTYTHNPLVNAMCVGLIESRKLVSAVARGAGSLLVLIGADTGRDGIHGASGLASRTFEEQRELRSTVQVGNPFLEKVLIEACLELVDKKLIEGMQDLGAAGLTSASVESAARGGSGVDLDVSRVPRREAGMTPYEVMLSESQERMLLVVRPEKLDAVLGVCAKWDILATVIGRVVPGDVARIREGRKTVGAVPVPLLSDPPLYRIHGRKPRALSRLQSADMGATPLPRRTPGRILRALLASPNIASKLSVYQQYDHMVLDNTLVAPGEGDAAVLRIKGTRKAIALAIDGNGRQCYLDPETGGAMAVAEAARNVVCAGAEPIAATNCLNFGNPEKSDVAYQLVHCTRGMARACRALELPIISGNVSLYNETQGEAIYPTPVIGVLGLLERAHRRCTMGFKNEGDLVYLLGPLTSAAADLAGSEYLERVHGLVQGRPAISLDTESRVQRACLDGIRAGIVRSAHDCSDGGLAVAIAESAIAGGLGVHIETNMAGRWDALLFGEPPSRIVVSVAPEDARQLESLARRRGAPLRRIGVVQGRRFVWTGWLDEPVSRLADAWRHGLERAAR